MGCCWLSFFFFFFFSTDFESAYCLRCGFSAFHLSQQNSASSFSLSLSRCVSIFFSHSREVFRWFLFFLFLSFLGPEQKLKELTIIIFAFCARWMCVKFFPNDFCQIWPVCGIVVFFFYIFDPRINKFNSMDLFLCLSFLFLKLIILNRRRPIQFE